MYNFHEALKQLTIMVNLLPNDKTIWIQRGLVYQDLGNHDLAIADFAEAIEIDSTCSEAMFHMATSKLKANMTDASIEEFQKSAAIHASAKIQDGLGCCYHKKKDYDQAISAFDKAIIAEPNNIEFLKNRAQCYSDMGQF